MTNGVLLHKTIHDLFHDIYSRGTTEEFEQFLSEKYQITEYPWRQGNHQPSLSVEDLVQRRLTEREQKFQEMQKTFLERGHTFVEGKYVNIDSPLVLYCTHHKVTTQTTYRKYKHAKTGLPCCGRALLISSVRLRYHLPQSGSS